jgi:predicted transcriptional regulator
MIVFSFLATRNQFGLLTSNGSFSFLPSFSSQVALEDAANSTRTQIYDFIVSNPGIQFRGICSGLEIAIGTAEFHLGILKKAGLISFVRDGKYKRFFASNKFSSTETKLISLLRHETMRGILNIISAAKTISHSKLASNLSITSQGLTWQMNRLREEGIVQEFTDGIKVIYSINETYLKALPELLCLTAQT